MQLRVRVHTDVEAAASARDPLDGRSIPRHLLPEHIGSCQLHISYSAHRPEYEVSISPQQVYEKMSIYHVFQRVLAKLRSQNTCYLGQSPVCWNSSWSYTFHHELKP